MQDLSHIIKDKNTVNSKINNLNNSKQLTVREITRVLDNLTDVIPQDDYIGFYINRYRELGSVEFMRLIGKARAGSDTPQRLFCWMLKNPELVR